MSLCPGSSIGPCVSVREDLVVALISGSTVQRRTYFPAVDSFLRLTASPFFTALWKETRNQLVRTLSKQRSTLAPAGGRVSPSLHFQDEPMSVSQQRLAAVQNFHSRGISLCKRCLHADKKWTWQSRQKKEETLSEMNWGVCSDFEESHGSEMSSVETGTRMSHLWRRGRMFAENRHT